MINLTGIQRQPAADLAVSTYRQAITAAGTGAAAGSDAERWLADRGASTPTTRQEEDR